jgi:hypothetical protein
MVEAINWFLWSVGLLALGLGFIYGLILWSSIVADWWAEISPSVRGKQMIKSLSTVRRYLSGFDDLEIIWAYIDGRSEHHSVEAMRNAYAKARNTDVYGKPKEELREAK